MSHKNTLYKMEMLALALLRQREYYGYELVQKLNSLAGGQIAIKEGTLYPILYSLAKWHYISSTEVAVNRKLRVIYTITEDGIDYYNQLVEEYREMSTAVCAILDYMTNE